MGDRITIVFVDENDYESPALYAHWEGMNMLNLVNRFYNEYHGKIRSEASNWLFNFVLWMGQEGVACIQDGNFYLERSEEYCDLSDNGLFKISTVSGEIL